MGDIDSFLSKAGKPALGRPLEAEDESAASSSLKRLLPVAPNARGSELSPPPSERTRCKAGMLIKLMWINGGRTKESTEMVKHPSREIT